MEAKNKVETSGPTVSLRAPPGLPSTTRFSPRTIVISESLILAGTFNGFSPCPETVSIRTNNPLIVFCDKMFERISGPTRV